MKAAQQQAAELAVLSISAQSSDARLLALEWVTADDFTVGEHRAAWEAMASLDHVGPVELVQAGVKPDMVEALINGFHGSKANIETYCASLTKAARVRAIRAMAREIAADEDGEPDDLVERIVTTAQKVMGRSRSTAVPFADAMQEASAYIREAQARHRSGRSVGARFGLPTLDYVLGGLTGPRLIILAARPACGKTALLNQMAVVSARGGYPGMIFSLEMGSDELSARAVAADSGVIMARLLRGTAKADELGRADGSMVELGKLPIWLDTETYRLESICAQAAVMKARHGIQWIAVDHIGLVETERANSRNDQMGLISRALKQLAKRLNIPVIALSQLNRSSDTQNRQPGLADLRDSGNIEQDADIVLMMHCAQAERVKDERLVQIGAPKNRCGPATWLDSPVLFRAPTQVFQEMATSPQSGAQPHWQDAGENWT